MNEKERVLIGSPIRQAPEVLDKFLNSLTNLQNENILVDYFFVDDNDNKSSIDMLNRFRGRLNEKIFIQQGDKSDIYIRDKFTHHWKESTVWKVAEYKNKIIEYCKNESYDYLFLVDSDIVLHPKTLNHLIHTNKDIISEIFWTKWYTDSVELPQVWLYDNYSLVPKGRLENIDQAESNLRYSQFIEQLRIPNVYQVGGLGACTLINKKALDGGVNFNEIYNLSFWGEDRHFCIRAAALGFKLYVDTTYPAYHIYRTEDINGVEEFINKCKGDIKVEDLNSINKIKV